MYLTLTPNIQKTLSDAAPAFEQIMQWRGEVYRALENRRTQRIQINDQFYFIKQHYGVGWKEIFKNLVQGRLPITSAKNEFLALQRLVALGIPTLTIEGYGNKGLNPATQQSFLLTQELPPTQSLEDLTREWRVKPPSFRFKLSLIQAIATIASTLHRAGINHRDFYICHFLLDLLEYSKGQVKLFLIDLHRAQIRQRTPERWLVKDLAGLYFSSRDIGLTQRDLLRFIRYYRQEPLRQILQKESFFWKKVKTRGDKLYRRHTN